MTSNLDEAIEHALKRPWLSWVAGDESLVLRVYDEPPLFIRFLPWHAGMHIGFTSEWVEYGHGENIGWEWDKKDANLTILKSEWLVCRGLPVWKYIQTIPEEIRDVAIRYSYNQIKLLQILSLHEEAKELASHNPNLLWLLACKIKEVSGTRYDQDKQLKCKQKKILSFVLNREISNSRVKLLRKIHVTEGDSFLYELLKLVLTEESVVAYFTHHWSRIPQSLISTIIINESMVLSRVLSSANEIAVTKSSREYVADIVQLWKDTVNLGNLMGGGKEITNTLNRIQNLTQLQKLHDKWVNSLNTHKINEFMLTPEASTSFHFPFFIPDPHIQQIKNYRELFNEGKYMRNCIFFSRFEHANDGRHCYFRVLHPQRCSLEVIKVDNKWVMSELKARDNIEPVDETIGYVSRWLSQSNKINKDLFY